MIIEEIDIFHDKKIIIYGAGTYGCYLHTFLGIKGMDKNVICFAVSDMNGNPKNLFGKPVVLFDSLDFYNDEIVYIVAMNEKHFDAVAARLGEKNVTNIYKMPLDFLNSISYQIYEECRKLPIKKDKVFFYCYGGMGYRCNCKYIAEKLLEGIYPVELVWGVSSAENGSDIPKEIKIVNLNDWEYFQEIYTSSIIICNDGRPPSVYKREGQFCINTWHGYGPFKKVNGALSGCDEKKIRERNSYFDLFLTGSRFYSQIYRDSFFYEGEIAEWGAPRNDVFFKELFLKEKIYSIYKIPVNKKVILYAPTFRNESIFTASSFEIIWEEVLNAARERFQQEYVLMYRFHHKLYQTKERVNYFERGIDVTLYPDIQELLVAADIVITDYSSLMWDFSLQKKPVFLFQNDKEEYENSRGFYAPVSDWPYLKAHTQKELLESIKTFDNERYNMELTFFLEKYGSCDDGHATERVISRIMNKIEAETNI